MEKFINFMDSKVAPIAVKIGEQKHIKAISQGMIGLVGIIIVASLATLVQNLQIEPYQNFLMNTAPGQVIWNICQNITWGCLNMYAILICGAIGQSLWNNYGNKGLEGAAIALACYFVTIPWMPEITVGEVTEKVYGWMHYDNFSSVSLFTCMVVALLAVEVLQRFTKVKALKVKMPDTVPPAVSDSFSKLFPIIFTVVIFSILTFVITVAFDGKSLSQVINYLIAAPLQGLSSNIFAAILIPMLISFLWFFGLHGSSIMGPIIAAVLATGAMTNMEMYSAGITDWGQYNILTPEFLASFVYMGGAGCTISLLVAMFIVNKRRHKMMLSLAGPTSIFNINEPLIFGFPIILNSMLFIPFVLGPAILGLISYLAVDWGLVHPVVTSVPWTTPPILRGFLATGMHWTGAALAAFNLVLGVVMYLPFVKLIDNQERKAANEQLNSNSKDKIQGVS
ncbi:MAG: PTS sugar transporter subunit IIC [Romboutsia sp.]|uniref:PTS sugar transporter subunit IIC n=1 Tax=Romboutsia sp. TaxID=1965302 RepID=UPI003F400C39